MSIAGHQKTRFLKHLLAWCYAPLAVLLMAVIALASVPLRAGAVLASQSNQPWEDQSESSETPDEEEESEEQVATERRSRLGTIDSAAIGMLACVTHPRRNPRLLGVMLRANEIAGRNGCGCALRC